MRCENFKANASSAGECPISRRVPDEKPRQLAALMRNLRTTKNEKIAPPSASSAGAEISSDSTAREEGRNKIAEPLAEVTGLDKCTAAAMGDGRTQYNATTAHHPHRLPAHAPSTNQDGQTIWLCDSSFPYTHSQKIKENVRKFRNTENSITIMHFWDPLRQTKSDEWVKHAPHAELLVGTCLRSKTHPGTATQ